MDGEKIVFSISLHKTPEEVTFEDCLKSHVSYKIYKKTSNKGKITQFTTYNNKIGNVITNLSFHFCRIFLISTLTAFHQGTPLTRNHTLSG